MFEYWYLLPLGLTIATISISAGISGSNFWLPVLLLVIGLPPRLAFWLALTAVVLGNGSGVCRNLRAGTIDLLLASRLMVVAMPAALVGSIVTSFVDDRPLLLGFAAVAAIGAIGVLRSPAERTKALVSRPHKVQQAAALGGLLQGLVITGCGVVLLPTLLRHQRARPEVLVGTSVLVVLSCALTAALMRIDAQMLEAMHTHRAELWHALPFAIPGVVVGGQLGPRIAARLRLATLERYFAVLLLVVCLSVAALALAG
ncbi:MAG: sulfite exporter TauE/SafE family protein [Myxococcales bacterium]|nr:sulfite exporter TauE/SafE family protein [Myxococcales bacterium]